MESNRSEFKSHGYLINSTAELLEIQIASTGDAARYQSTVRWSSKGVEIIRGRWQEIRYTERNGRPYITMFGKRLYIDNFLKKITNMAARDYRFEYMLLNRLQCDCNYYLGYGNRCAKQLWALDEQKQINKMRELYDLVPEKPEWLTKEQINEYAAKMGVK